MEIITSIISKIGEMLVEPTGRQLGYLFHYKVNIKALEDEIDKLKNRRDDVQRLIDAAIRNSEVIGAEVKRWVSDVDKITNELGEFLKEYANADKKCFNGCCPNLKLQHSLGRKATKYTEDVLKLQEEGKPFAKLSYPASPTRMHFSSSSMKDFNSRKKILNQVMEALRNEKVSVTAICGMGGIGKTTMAKEVAKRAKKPFGDVVMVTVSQNPNVREIQGKIADFLDLKLDKESEEGRAYTLRQRILENTENILLILDDLWNKLDLEAVGIPDRCKILLTSRNEDVCKQMKSQEIFPIKVLGFNSRNKILNQVMEALRNEKVSVIAICGMGEIGKTTMAKEVARRAKEKPFGDVVMVTVSQNPNVREIQGKIADFLDLKLDKESEEGRAYTLRQRILENTENILLILDDLWNKLDLEAVGIPDRCKILLTSRNEDVCKQMKSQEIFPIKVLSEDEGWNLFEEVAGISDRTCTRDLYDVAKKVAKECKGLPVAIVTVGRALENRDESDWKDALLKLEKSIPDSMLKTDVEVYSRIELSYDLLRSEEAKSCFLLCCLFPEDYDIGIHTLVRYGKGLRLFQETGTMEQTRHRVHTLVGYLKRCFLLMDGNKTEHVLMHDIVRDVAISIAARKEHGGFAVKCDNQMEQWPEIDSSEMEYCTAISLVFKQIKKHPDGLACPSLKLLRLSSTTAKNPFLVKYHGHKFELSENFFEGIKEIKVLAFQCIYVQTLPASLQMLQNLRTLHLEYCVLGDISRIGGLEMLEILSLIGSWIQQELPKEIGNLQHLKVLDMTKCKGLNRIPPGVLSRLTTLEELKIFCFDNWNSLEGNEEKTSASLDEINPRDLKVLNVRIPNVEFVPRNFPFKNLTRFLINVGTELTFEDDYLFRNFLQLHEVSADSIKQSGIHPIFKKCEHLRLDGVYDLKNLFPHSDEEEQDGFPWLRTLKMWSCKEMEYVVKFTSNNNRTDLHVPDIFPLLEELYLMNLDGLKGIFHYNSDYLQLPPTNHQSVRKERISTASSLPRGFPQLQRLTELTLHNLPSLISLSTAIDDEGSTRPPKDADGVESNMDNMNTPTKILVPFKCIKWLPSLEKLVMSNCDSIKVLFGFHGHDSPQLDPNIIQNSQEIIDTSHLTKDVDQDCQLNNHKEEWLMNLEDLDVEGCDSLEVLFDYGEGPLAPALNKLESLELRGLEKLMHIWKKGPQQVKTVGFQNLKTLSLHFCPSLRYLFTASIAKLLVMLESLKVTYCESMEEVVAKTEEDINNVNVESYMVLFPNLVSIELNSLDNLCCFCPQPYAFEFPFLETLQIRNCPKLQTFITANKPPKTPNLMGVQLDDKDMEILEQDLNGTIRHCFEANQICAERSEEEEGDPESIEEEEEEVEDEEEEEPDMQMKKCIWWRKKN
ncbi:probable disease resistance protein At4g27220 [Ziziphus jujuba]|uniref:Probable disease resistance protein At4g27220 n=1 Tax=Ziziphus jujuba TaxID=326968 RepID=A0ABM3I5N7_ZIZJJ|nr:probable disease resistance protein At4g27220 [Ziziphus jujuba]